MKKAICIYCKKRLEPTGRPSSGFERHSCKESKEQQLREYIQNAEYEALINNKY